MAVVAALAWFQWQHAWGIGNVVAETPRFTLTDHFGRTVTEAAFRGRYLLIYFGYTFCPDICPTSLTAIAEVLKQLGPKADKIVPILISFDPGRDTPAALADYVALFGPGFVGLTGTPEQVAAAAAQFGVVYRKVGDGADYVIDHSADIYLVGPDGRYVATFRHGTNVPELAVGIATAMTRVNLTEPPSVPK